MALYIARRPDGLVKIGCSQNVERRMKQLGAELVREMPGGFAEERGLHLHYAHLHRGGECFEWCPTMMAVVPAPGSGAWLGERATSKPPLISIVTIIDQLGGYSGAAALVGCSAEAARKWPRSGIPWMHFSPIKHATGISYDDLAKANAGTPRAERAPATPPATEAAGPARAA